MSTPAVLLATWLRLRIRGYRGALAAAQPARQGESGKGEALEIARDTALAVAVAMKYGPWRPRCLLRSLVLVRFLARKGIACDVRIGLPADQPGRDLPGEEPGFSAHAWVECDGVVLNDRDDVAARFTPFDAPLGNP